jgi:hypothetical protein
MNSIAIGLRPKFSINDMTAYRTACRQILERGTLEANYGSYANGICYTAEKLGAYNAYQITRKLSSSDAAYNDGFGKPGEMTDTRIFFLLFVSTLSIRELREMAS